MHQSRFPLLTLCVAAALTGHAIAQGDDCTGALAVTNGTSGPYTNVGSTTSAPAWPCAAGGNDVWFSYVAASTGNVVVNTCGSGFDTAMQIFDGTGGCGGLVAIACNDDFCGLQSQLTVAVTAGTTYFIRIGGFASSTGTFTLSIGTPATVVSQGPGCFGQYASFYELMTAPLFDLSGLCMTMTNTGSGYVVTVAPGVINPVGSLGTAAPLTLTDDSQTVAGSLGVSVGSNCWIALGTGNSNAFTPTVATMLGNPATAFYSWKDLNPAAAGSGLVQYEQAGTQAQITYDGVYAFGTTTPNTIQFNIDTATGNVTICWGVTGTVGTSWLVGYSPGGPSGNPGGVDLSALNPGGVLVTAGSDTLPLSLTAVGTPVQGPNAMQFDVTTGDIPASALIHVGIVGLTRPGVPLGLVLGATDCFLNSSLDVTVGPAFFPGPTFTWTALNLPALPPSFAGFEFNAQGAILGTTLNSALGLGLLTSNGLKCTVGDL